MVRDIGDTTVQLSWSRGFDNHSPIARYNIEARTLLSNKWKQMRTSKCPRGYDVVPEVPAWGHQLPAELLLCARRLSTICSICSPLVLLDYIDPVNIEGNAETAQVVNLIPWMDYEFRVLASNILGVGEPSLPSSKIRTKEAGMCRHAQRWNGESEAPTCRKRRLACSKPWPGQLVFSLSAPRGEPIANFSAFLPIYTSKTKNYQNWQPASPA